MKIIFLDIDGVLAVNFKDNRDEYGAGFHPEFVENLRYIIERTGAKIVLSSSWRKSGFVEIKKLWEHRNLPGEVIDVTCGLYLQKGGCIRFFNDKLSEHPTPEIKGYSIPRGCEIDYWLKDKGFSHIYWCDKTQKKYIEESGITGYVIIDDDADMLLHQNKHFVCTSGNNTHADSVEGYGLTSKCANIAINILNRGFDYEY